jgi:hypothetical protein
MIDPHDDSTLDLVELAKQPLSAAERQRRHREKKKREREEGKRFELALQAEEVALLRAVLKGCRGRADAVELLDRLPEVACAEVEAPAVSVAPPANSLYQLESLGCVAPSGYRQTPVGQPEVDALVKPGDVVRTSYGSGPYQVKEVKRFDCSASDLHDLEGMHWYTLTMKSMDGRGAACWINELVAVDGRLLKLFANNEDEVFVDSDVEDQPEAVEVSRDIAPSLLDLKPGQPQLDIVWNQLPTDFSRAASAIGLLRLRDRQHAELLWAVEVLQGRLQQAGLSDQLERWHWNENPARDYRPATPPEYLERISCEMTNSWGDKEP